MPRKPPHSRLAPLAGEQQPRQYATSRRGETKVMRVEHGIEALTVPLRYTTLRNTTPITKRLCLAADGSIQKTSTANHLSNARIIDRACSPAEFVRDLQAVKTTDCNVYGVPKDSEARRIITKRDFEIAQRPAGSTTRTNEAFAWPDGPGLLMLDYDPEGVPLRPEELLRAVYDACPCLRFAAHIWATSTSSCVTHANTGAEIRGIEGQRVYIVVSDATDIHRAAGVLHQRLWLAGHGYIKVSKSGALLERSIVDLAVFQPSRIDYCAPAICEPPLRQEKPAPRLHGDPKMALDTTIALPDLSETDRQAYSGKVAAAKAEKRVQAAATRASYVDQRVEQLHQRGVPADVARYTVETAVSRSVLHGDFVLLTENGEEVTVAQLLADRQRWNRARFADPLEPEYHNDKRIAMAFLGSGRPTLHSFAHGGQLYALTKARLTLRVIKGERHRLVEQIVGELSSGNDPIYCRNGELVAVGDAGKCSNLNHHELLALIDSRFRFEQFSKGKSVAADLDQWLAKHILEGHVQRFPKLRATTTAPILDPKSGRILKETGYDAPTQLLLDLPAEIYAVPEHPTMEGVLLALKIVWWALRMFPFAKPEDQSIALAGIFTAVLRPLLPTAPAFAIDAPVQGSGKTLLARTFAAVAGHSGAMLPYVNNEEETRKRLFAALLEGQSIIIIDNVLGQVDSSSIASYLTSERYSDRILKESKNVTVEASSMLVLTGNNIVLKGDLPRRVLKCRISPEAASPHKRHFPFDPAELVTEHRQQIVSAVLTLIVAAQRAMASAGRFGPGRLASFEVWDDLVRQTICWLAEQQAQKLVPIGLDSDSIPVPELVDPMVVIDDATSNAPDVVALKDLLQAWHACIGGKPVTVKELVDSAVLQVPPAQVLDPQAQSVLRAALEELAGEGLANVINKRKLGNRLSYKKDSIAGGYRLRADGTYQNSTKWRVEPV